jgi:protein-L-isoaspartate O-methyltransferase
MKVVPGSRKARILEASPGALRPAVGLGIDVVRRGRIVGRNAVASVARRALPVIDRVLPASGRKLRESGWLWQPGFGYKQVNRLYDGSVDPYRFESNPYEVGKYAHTAQLLSGRRYGRALEIGAAEGVFTEQLAPLCESVVAIDVAAAAVERARERLAPLGNVEVLQAAIPGQWPDGRFDLIVASDVLYFFPKEVLSEVAVQLGDRLLTGGTLIAVHFLGDFGQSMGGDEVHELLLSKSGLEKEREETVEGVGPAGAGYTVVILRKPSSGAAA